MNVSEKLRLIRRTGDLVKLLKGFVAPFSASVSNELCRNHSSEYVHELKNEVPWALKMFDASAKMQTGVLTGNINSLGNYDECISVTNTTGEFVGQHCLANIRILNRSSEVVHGDELKHMLQRGIKWGYCIPSSCSAEDLEDSLIDYIKPTEDLHIQVNEYHCHYDGDLPFTVLDWFTISLFAVIFLLVILSTGYELSREKLRKIRANKPLAPTTKYGSANGHSNGIPEMIQISELNGMRQSCQNSARSSSVSLEKRFPNHLSFNEKSKLTYLSNKTLTERPESVNQSESGMDQHSRQKISPDCGTSVQNLKVPRNNHEFEQHVIPKILPDTQNSASIPNGTENCGNVQTNSVPANAPDLRCSSDSEVSSRKANLQHPALDPGLTPTPNSEENPQYTNATRWSFWSMYASPVEGDPQDGVRMKTSSPMDDFLDPSYRDLTWLSSFSVFSNGKHIFYLDYRKSTLQSLYGMKFLSALWVFIGSTVSIEDLVPSLNYLSYKHNRREWYYMLINQSYLGIDTFFVITGVMISYTFLRDMRRIGIYYKENSPSGMTWRFYLCYLPLHYLQHFMRLTPVLALMVLVEASLYTHFGSGPFWYRNSYIEKNACKKYWWSTLIYLANYINGDNMCLSHMWYLMVDMQLYFFSPLILLAFVVWSKKINFILASVLLFLEIVISYAVNYNLEIPVGEWNSEVSKWKLRQHEFILTHIRYGPWIVGLFVGYLLYNMKKSETRPNGSKFAGYPRWFWLLSGMGIFYSLFGAITFYTPNPDNTPVNAALYNSLFRNVWALCIGWIIFACETNNGVFVQSILTKKFFQPLCRLTYCIYLVQFPLMIARALTTRTPIEKSEIDIISSVCANTVLSSIVALILVLCVELPFIRLFEALTFPLQYRVEQLATARQRTSHEDGEGNSSSRDNPQELSERTPLLTS